jgi:hypothetical protein
MGFGYRSLSHELATALHLKSDRSWIELAALWQAGLTTAPYRLPRSGLVQCVFYGLHLRQVFAQTALGPLRRAKTGANGEVAGVVSVGFRSQEDSGRYAKNPNSASPWMPRASCAPSGGPCEGTERLRSATPTKGCSSPAPTGGLSRNRRKFRHPSSNSATSASRSIILPSLWKV